MLRLCLPRNRRPRIGKTSPSCVERAPKRAGFRSSPIATNLCIHRQTHRGFWIWNGIPMKSPTFSSMPATARSFSNWQSPCWSTARSTTILSFNHRESLWTSSGRSTAPGHTNHPPFLDQSPRRNQNDLVARISHQKIDSTDVKHSDGICSGRQSRCHRRSEDFRLTEQVFHPTSDTAENAAGR